MGPAPQASRGAPDLPRGPLTRAGPDQFIAGQDKRLEAIEAMLLKLGQRMDELGSQNST